MNGDERGVVELRVAEPAFDERVVAHEVAVPELTIDELQHGEVAGDEQPLGQRSSFIDLFTHNGEDGGTERVAAEALSNRCREELQKAAARRPSHLSYIRLGVAAQGGFLEHGVAAG
ncbi:hypothetical protein ACFQI9_39450 [Paraburkholderia dipogonis]|uniref:hypothetical protein n=1 Tax=Paraburkholderia dipogonis TaxID=1211383 RepID=UPI00360C1E70